MGVGEERKEGSRDEREMRVGLQVVPAAGGGGFACGRAGAGGCGGGV